MQSDGNEQLSADKMRQLKAQRMQALMREVSGLAAMPNRTIQGNGFSLLGNGLRRPGDASSNRREDSMGFGPQRRDFSRNNSSRPYPPSEKVRGVSVSRTASTVSRSSPPPDFRESEDLAVAGLLGLSPLSSPQLASCVSLLPTPELLAAIEPSFDPPPPMSLPQQHLGHEAPPRLPSPVDRWQNAPCPSPVPTTGQIIDGSWLGVTPEQKPKSLSMMPANKQSSENGSLLLPRCIGSFTCLDMMHNSTQ